MILLGPFQADGEGGWQGPEGATHCLDLRPVSDQAKRSRSASGKGVFWVPDGTAFDSTQYDKLADRWDGAAGAKVKSALKSKGGKDLSGDDLLGCLWSLLTDASDLNGESGLKPIMPTVRGRLDLHFGGISHSLRYSESSPHVERIRATRERDIAKIRGLEDSGKVPRGHHEKALGMVLREMGVRDADWQDVIKDPRNRNRIRGPREPQTSVSDSFTRANETPIASPWVQCHGSANGFNLASNRIDRVGTAGDSSCIYNSALSGSNGYAQLDQVTGGTQMGPCFRWESTSVATGYGLTPASTCVIAKWVSGTRTSLATLTSGGAVGLFKITANGSSLEAFKDGVSIGTHTDTSISSGLYAGVTANSLSGLGDNFYAEDSGSSGMIFVIHNVSRGVFSGVFRGSF